MKKLYKVALDATLDKWTISTITIDEVVTFCWDAQSSESMTFGSEIDLAMAVRVFPGCMIKCLDFYVVAHDCHILHTRDEALVLADKYNDELEDEKRIFLCGELA